jgi:signal transduction histidine kinase
MSNESSRFTRIINKINILYGLQIPVGTMTFFAVLLWIFKPSYFQDGSLPIYASMISVVTIVSIIHSLKSETLSKRQLAVIYSCYHGALIIFTVLVAPFLTPFEFLWIALAIGMDLIFGKRPMYVTHIVYALTLAAAFFRTQQILSFELLIQIFGQYLGVVFISLQVSKYRSVSDAERTALDATFRSSSFERQRLLSLINNMGEAVVATDQKGKILIYNAAVLELLDTNQTLEGKSLDSVLKLKDGNGKAIKLSDLLKKHALGLTTTDYIHEFGPHDVINLYLNIAPVKLGFREETDSGYIMLMRDITKEKSLEEERDEFISVVSHELRTPVAIAEGNISNAMFMSDKNHDPKVVSESLGQAHEQVVFLANMINDLATLSRAERTDVPLEISQINPKELLESISNDYHAQAATKKLKLTFSAAKEVASINTAELYLREVLQNFITNAIKYTKKGTVLLHVRSNKAGDAVFSVADTGIGLSKADQKRVFDKFFRSEDYRTRESSGTGLGLYVTSKLAHRLNAHIHLESQLNKGTTFTITVPSLEVPKKH